MKRILTIALAVSVLSSCTDRSCTINGNISGLEGEGWVYLKDASNGFEVIDSARYNKGTFTLEMKEVEFETGIAQVSMNMTNLSVTPLHAAFDEVCRAADARGVRVTGAEIVGLVPKSALVDALF